MADEKDRWVLHWRDSHGNTGEREIDDAFTVGRSSSADLVFDSPKISRTHARFGLSGGGRPVVEDLGSANGTHLNGQVITSTFVNAGDQLRIGDVAFWVAAKDAPTVQVASPLLDSGATLVSPAQPLQQDPPTAAYAPPPIAPTTFPTSPPFAAPPPPAYAGPIDVPSYSPQPSAPPPDAWQPESVDQPAAWPAAVAPAVSSGQFKAGSARAIFAQIAVVLAILSGLVIIATAANRVMVIDDFENGDAGLSEIDDADTALAAAIALQWFVAAPLLTLFSLLWIYRAHKNLHPLGAQKLNFSSAGSVWWWFVPIANIIQGLRILREIGRESNGARRQSKLALICWILAIAGGVAVAVAILLPGDTIDEIRTADITIAATMPLLILAWAVFFAYIRSIRSAQKRRARELGLTS